jgi:hypothetical protein
VSLQIGSSITGGLRRVANRNGLLLVLAYLVIGTVWQVLFYSAIATWLQRTGGPMGEVSLPAVDLPLSVSAGGAVLSLLVLQYLTVVAIRTFVGGHSRSIPSEYYTRNIVFVLVNSIVGGLVFGVLVSIGTVLLVVPGIVAYVAFIFMLLYVAVDDENFVAALRDSWNLTRGNWLRLFALLVILFVGIGIVSGVLSALVSMAAGAVGGPALGTLLSGVVTLPFSLFSLGVLAEAFDALRGGRARARAR